MVWLVIIVLVVVLWVASLFKIFYASCSPSKSTFLYNGEAVSKKRSCWLLPVLTMSTCSLHQQSTTLFQGGTIFTYCPCQRVPLQQVKILGHPDLQDGFGKVWDCSLLARIMEMKIFTHAIDVIITFDNYAVSGHCNHRDVNYGIRMVLNENSQSNTELGSLSVLTYCGRIVDLLIYGFPLYMPCDINPDEQMHSLLNEHPYRSYTAMAQHMSQWVWFRKLFVSYSSYTYVNTLRKIKK